MEATAMADRAPGQVRDAIMAVMRETGGKTIRVEGIIEAVEKRLGGPVAPSSVRSYLQIGSSKYWERVSRGTYRARG